MAASVAQVFKGINAEQYTRLTEKAKGAGIVMEGNNGTATRFGVEIEWNYSPETQELSLQCLKHPFFVSAEDVNAKVRDLVHQTLA